MSAGDFAPDPASEEQIEEAEPQQPPPEEQAIEDGPLADGGSGIIGDGFFLDEIIVSLIVVAGAVASYFIIRYFLNRAADSLNLERGQLKGIYSITKLVLLVISITAIIFQFSSASGVAAGAISVAAGTIIGFSSRNTISNAIAGILLLSARPFKIGDRIRTTEDEDLVGDVIEITIIYTKIKTIRNELVAIPNQTLLQRQIVNYSGLDTLAATVDVAVTFENDRKQVESLLVKSARKTEGVLEVPEPQVSIKRFESYAAVYELRAFTNRPNEYLKIQSEVRKNVYDTFQMHGVDLTVPQAQKNVADDGSSQEDPKKDKAGFRQSLT